MAEITGAARSPFLLSSPIRGKLRDSGWHCFLVAASPRRIFLEGWLRRSA